MNMTKQELIELINTLPEGAKIFPIRYEAKIITKHNPNESDVEKMDTIDHMNCVINFQILDMSAEFNERIQKIMSE